MRARGEDGGRSGAGRGLLFYLLLPDRDELEIEDEALVDLDVRDALAPLGAREGEVGRATSGAVRR